MSDPLGVAGEIVGGLRSWWHEVLNEKVIAPLLRTEVILHLSDLQRTRQHADLILQALLKVLRRTPTLQNAVEWHMAPHAIARQFIDERLGFPDLKPSPTIQKLSMHTGKSSFSIRALNFLGTASHVTRQISEAAADAPETLATQFEKYINNVKLACSQLKVANTGILDQYYAMTFIELPLESMHANRMLLSTVPTSSGAVPDFPFHGQYTGQRHNHVPNFQVLGPSNEQSRRIDTTLEEGMASIDLGQSTSRTAKDPTLDRVRAVVEADLSEQHRTSTGCAPSAGHPAAARASADAPRRASSSTGISTSLRCFGKSLSDQISGKCGCAHTSGEAYELNNEPVQGFSGGWVDEERSAGQASRSRGTRRRNGNRRGRRAASRGSINHTGASAQ